MIRIKEVSLDKIEDFWKEHLKYLVDDEIVTDIDELDYFSGAEYRGTLERHMERKIDKHHLVYFIRNLRKIGAASFCTYQSEDGKCFILDFWVYPEFRGYKTGTRCFKALERYTKADGARYYELNVSNENSKKFWQSVGFESHGKDEYDMELLIRM